MAHVDPLAHVPDRPPSANRSAARTASRRFELEGEVAVDYEGHGRKIYRAGDAFMEAMAAPHAATNVGKTQVRILATFLETAT